MRPFSITEFSIDHEVLCHDGLAAMITGEILRHTCWTRSRNKEDTVCPACWVSAGARAEHASTILPLYFADELVREEL